MQATAEQALLGQLGAIEEGRLGELHGIHRHAEARAYPSAVTRVGSGRRKSDLVKRIDTIRPDVVVVLMSGFAEPELHHDIEVGADAFVPKPFTRDQLLDSIRTALERPRG